MVLGCVLLAAGLSRRMGRPKQLLTYEGETLLDRALATYAVMAPLAVVLTNTIQNGDKDTPYDWV